MGVSSLADCQKLRENGMPVEIRREVRYFAVIGRKQYVLTHDWEIESLDQRLWKRKAKKKLTVTERSE